MSTQTIEDQHAARNATPWYPHRSEGEGQPTTLTGTVMAIDSVYSDYHDATRIKAVIRDGEGQMWDVRSYPTRLHDEWLSARPQIGEVASVKFTGMRERKVDKKAYPDFSVAVEREAPAAFDYTKLDAPPEPETPPADVSYLQSVAPDEVPF
jgi:hypothetical protein